MIYSSLPHHATGRAATSDPVAAAAAPPAVAESLCSEVVEARVHEGLHFRCGGQTVSFGDSPQVCRPSQTVPPCLAHVMGQRASLHESHEQHVGGQTRGRAI